MFLPMISKNKNLFYKLSAVLLVIIGLILLNKSSGDNWQGKIKMPSPDSPKVNQPVGQKVIDYKSTYIVPFSPLCGNKKIETTEECDDGKQCGDRSPCQSNLDCEGKNLPTTDCVVRIGDGCDNECLLEICGNGRKNFNEGCDDGGLCQDNKTACAKDADCGALGHCTPRDGDGCNKKCQIDENRCGDRVITGGEECDGWSTTCDTDCSLTRCGDFYINTYPFSETCDDGGQCENNPDIKCNVENAEANCGRGVDCIVKNGDGCDTECLEEICGNLIIQREIGEECDEGPRETATCTRDCKLK